MNSTNRKNKKIVGIIGLGSVGWATVHSLSPQYDYRGYDINGSYSFGAILETDIVFICVSTPLSKENRLDCSAVDAVLSRLNRERYQNCIVIKSTLSVGFMDAAAKRYPQLHLVYMPEFLRERSSFTWCCNPDRLVVSGDDTDIDDVLSYFEWVPEMVPRLRMSWKSAEIGKLAHNAFIATKVSFTNEMESLSLSHGANPADVMHVVWVDRRVGNSEHLKPYLGGYSGKCVPKDTKELLNCGGAHPLLTAVEDVNNNLPQTSCSTSKEDIIVIIPTRDRAEFLESISLHSLSQQRQKPSKVYVVYDENDQSSRDIPVIVSKYTSSLSIVVLKNTHEQNLSGAVNTALEQASLDYPNHKDVFAAILDDDDWWDISYLQNVLKFSEETNVDWVVSGLIRHDEKNTAGYHQSIPQTLDTGMFYVSNPNIQGSNLFVRLSCLLSIGGFDENLVSTTDRDVCIRLLKNKTSYAVLNNHLVHHNALDDHLRLSQPGNEKKRNGLTEFYRKYSPEMTEKQKEEFRLRAKTIFAVDIGEQHD